MKTDLANRGPQPSPVKTRSAAPQTGSLRTALTLNIVPIEFSSDEVVVGKLPDEGDESYRALREQHRHTHAFRFDSREGLILNVGLDAATEPFGERATVQTSEHLLLLARAIQQSLLRWLSAGRTILRLAHPLQCWGNRKANMYLTKAQG